MQGSQTSLKTSVTTVRTLPALTDAPQPTEGHPGPPVLTPAEVNQISSLAALGPPRSTPPPTAGQSPAL